MQLRVIPAKFPRFYQDSKGNKGRNGGKEEEPELIR